MSFLRKAVAITRKDILSEARTREIIFSALVFALLVIVTFNFAFGGGQADLNVVAPGILWVTFTFAGVLSLNRAFVPEKEESCLEGLMASPVPREAIYAGKMLASLLFMFVIEIIALPVFALLFDLPVFTGQLVLVTFLATVGFVAVGTLFAALAVNTKARGAGAADTLPAGRHAGHHRCRQGLRGGARRRLLGGDSFLAGNPGGLRRHFYGGVFLGVRFHHRGVSG